MHELLGQIRAGWQSSEAAPRFAAAMEGHLADAAALKDALLGHGAALIDGGRSGSGRPRSALAAAVPAVALMASIAVSYAALADGHDGLVATWNRIEGHLAELDARSRGRPTCPPRPWSATGR